MKIQGSIEAACWGSRGPTVIASFSVCGIDQGPSVRPATLEKHQMIVLFVCFIALCTRDMGLSFPEVKSEDYDSISGPLIFKRGQLKMAIVDTEGFGKAGHILQFIFKFLCLCS